MFLVLQGLRYIVHYAAPPVTPEPSTVHYASCTIHYAISNMNYARPPVTPEASTSARLVQVHHVLLDHPTVDAQLQKQIQD